MTMKRSFYLFTVLAACSWLSIGLAAQGTKTTIRATRVDKGPKIDGHLSDPVWKEAPPFTEFRMVEPTAGADPTERTEVRILYDEANLYIGIHCFDSEPSRIAANTLAHDASGNGGGYMGYGGSVSQAGGSDDIIKVLIDPFMDKRTAYVFYVNPRGAKSEGLVSGGSASLNWDGIWMAGSRIVDDGWSAELKVPFKTISFKPELTSWGLNIQRYIARKLETVRMSGITQDANFFNPMSAAELDGISGIKQGHGFTFKPYGLVNTENDRDPISDYKWKAQGGFDLYKNFTPNLVGAFSYNTDFAETEVDERRINLTRFPMYFSEKRMFFLEGSETFNFSSSVSFIPFFSRRIGLYEGNQIPINWGAKLYGKIGNTNLAIMDVETDAYGDEIPRNNMFAARVTQDIFDESKVGFILTNGSTTGDRNTLLGVDFDYSTSKFMGDKNLMLAAWGAYNWNEEDGRHNGFGFRANYPNDLINISSTYAWYGEALDPGLGYMMRQGIQTGFLELSYNPRPKKGFLGEYVRQFFFSVTGDFYWKLDGALETSTLSFEPLKFMLESGESFSAQMTVNHDVLPFDFEVADGVTLASGAYDYTNFSFNFESANHRPLVFELGGKVGQFYSGNLTELTAEVTYNFKGNFALSFDTDIVSGNLPEGKFKEHVYQLKLDYYFSPDLGFMNYIQYDDVSHVLGWSSRFRWEITPGNFIYFVYNKNWEKRWEPTSRFYPTGERGVFKVTLSIRP